MRAENPQVLVEAVHDGSSVDAVALHHGEHPVHALARAGWHAGTPLGAVSRPGPPWQVRLRYAARPGRAEDVPTPGRPPRDDGLSQADADGAVVRLRVAAYALVTSDRGLLLTELSSRTNVAGRWNLPGGGLDPGEAVVSGLDREVWEETDQHVVDVALVDIVSDHWLGRAPDGIVEDYHAVRLIHTAHCPAPSHPVIHDVGGSTSAARWFGWDRVGQVPLADSVAPLIRAAVRRHLAGS